MTLGANPMLLTTVMAEVDSALTAGSMLDDRVLWLADKTAGPVHFGDYPGKSSVKLVGVGAVAGGAATTKTLTGVNFGTAYTGRTLVALIWMYNGVSSVMNVSSVTIGGAAATGHDAGWATAGGSVGCGIFYASPGGTSGNIVINTTNNMGFVTGRLLSVSGIGAHSGFDGANSGSTTGIATGTLSTPSNGVRIGVGCRLGAGAALSALAMTAREEFASSDQRCLYGWDNRSGATASGIGVSTGGAANPMSCVGFSWAQ